MATAGANATNASRTGSAIIAERSKGAASNRFASTRQHVTVAANWFIMICRESRRARMINLGIVGIVDQTYLKMTRKVLNHDRRTGSDSALDGLRCDERSGLVKRRLQK